MNFSEHSSYRSARNVMWAIVAAHALFFMATPLFPFIDLPNHLAEATIYKYHGELGNSLASYYQPVPWYFPNTFHTVFCSLLPDVEVGNRLFMVVYVLGLHLSLFLVIRQIGGNPWYGLLGIVFTFNYNVTFGFVGFAISIPAVLLLFYLVLRDIERDSVRLKVAIAILLILIYSMHAQNALFALVLYGLMILFAYRNDLKKFLIRAALVPLPLVLLIFAWWFSRATTPEDSTSGYLLTYYKEEFLPEFLSRFKVILFDNYQLAPDAAGVIVAVALFLAVLLPVIYFKPWRTDSWRATQSQVAYPLIFLVCALGCYFILPTALPGQSPLSQRFCTFVNLAMIVAVSVLLRKVISTKLRNYALAVSVIYIVLWFEYVVAFNIENKSFRPEFFAGTDPENKLAALIYDNSYRRSKVYIHFPNYFIVWKRGIAATKIIDYRFGVVRRVVPEDVVPFYDEYVGDSYKYHPAYNNQDYLLVRGKAPVNQDSNLENSSIIRESEHWRLFRNAPVVSKKKREEQFNAAPIEEIHPSAASLN